MVRPLDRPLRTALVTVAQAAEDAQRAAERVGREAGQRAAAAAAAEMRTQAARLLREAGWIKRLAVAGLVAGSAGGGWIAGRQMPQATPWGRLSPAQMETVRFNDLGAALAACAPQEPRGGRDWCAVGWWLAPPPAPAPR